MTHFSRICAGLMLLLSSFLAVAQQNETGQAASVRLHIEVQPLSEALRQFAHQSGLQLVFRAEDVDPQLSAPALVGTYRPEAALKQLLRNSGLDYKFVNPGTVAVRPAGSAVQQESAAGREDAKGRAVPLRMAVAEDRSAVEEGGPGSGKAGHEAENESQKGVPEILVKGARSASTDIQRTEDDVQPYVVFTAEEIKNSMAADIESFLRTRLSMNQAASTESMTTGQRGGQSTINLRGLGADETLILVNGRRQPSIGQPNGLDSFQPDINGIPLSSIERIEVLPSTAGGIYGGGATGGVINVILKRGYQGLEMRGTYDGTTNGGNHKRRLEASGGLSLEGGRTSLSFAASYSDSAPLLAGDRDFEARARQQILDNDPASVQRGYYGPVIGYTTNIESVSGAPLVLVSTGQSLGSASTHVPVGYAGPDSDGGAAFLGTAGGFNTDLPDDVSASGLKRQVLAAPTVRSINLSLRREFTDRIEVFVDGLNYDNRAVSYFGGARNGNDGAIIPIGPGNPFTEPVRIGLPLTSIDRKFETQSSWAQTRSLTGGVIARLPANWSAQAEYSWNRSRSGYESNFYQITVDGEAAIKDGRLDPFRDVNAYPLDFSPYYVPRAPQTLSGSDYILKTATLRLAGPVWRLPAGPLMLSTLVEQRDALHDANVGILYARDGTPTYRYSAGNGNTTDSAYIELTAPLVSAVNARPGILGLELQTSYRYDRADIASRNLADSSALIPSPEGPYPPQPDTIHVRTDANQYTLGFRYQPLEQLALRASYGKGILPPSAVQLAPIVYPAYLAALLGGRTSDPKRGGGMATSLTELLAAGSASVLPEQSESISAGLILTPLSIPGLRVSIDYTRIDKRDEITRLDLQTVINLEDAGFADRVVRGALTPADQVLGYTAGPILKVDGGLVNVAKSLMEAFDAQIDYTWQTTYGEFKASMMGTLQPHLLQQILANQPTEEYVNTNLGPLKLRTNAGLTWTHENWALGWNMQYYGSYLVTNPGAFDNAARVVNNGGSPDIPSQHYHDLFGRYRFGNSFGPGWSGLLSNVELLVSVKNVLDTEPPMLVGNSFGGYFKVSPYGDPRLRSYAITLSKSFGR